MNIFKPSGGTTVRELVPKKGECANLISMSEDPVRTKIEMAGRKVEKPQGRNRD